ncbi:MAG: sigma-54-dependent Fis family transcriptional regulator, partial [Ignavibacteriales bacterium]|nr:sigma-54-dependent Fis family transcriptional regulator [Ignavibacteriales bacterium]
MTDILIIDDEEPIRHMLSLVFRKSGCNATSIDSAKAALKLLEREDFDFIISDIKMPGMDGIAFLNVIKEKNIRSVIIMMSAYGEVETALECIRLGAYDYISKPFKAEEMMLVVKKALERERLKGENIRLRGENNKELLTRDSKMTEILELVKKVAGYKTTILITGESGTGKELIARTLHFGGARSEGSFVAVNCGAIPAQLLESELFGFVKGAFTDAHRTKPGLFHEAEGGTIFLDEVGELPVELQVKLLRALEEGTVRKVGDTKEEPLNVRVLAATSRNLAEEIKKGAFRDDLYYRLNVITVELPPLRERDGDIEILANH